MKRYFFLCLFLLIPIFLPLLKLYFVSDDFIWLTEAKANTFFSVGHYFVNSDSFFYRPFTKIYFLIAWQFFGFNPLGYHIVNIVLHVLNTILIFVFLRLLLVKAQIAESVRQDSRFRDDNGMMKEVLCLAGALLFFVQSIHLENVAWISTVTELFPPLFVISALCIFIKTRIQAERVPFIIVLLICLLFVLGLFSHEYVVVFPLLILLTDQFLYVQYTTKITGYWMWLHSFYSIVVRQWLFYGVLVLIDIGYLSLRAFSNAHWSGGDYSYNLFKLPFNFVGNLLSYVLLNFVGISFFPIYQSLRLAGKSHFSLILLSVVVIFSLLTFGFFFIRRQLVIKYRGSLGFSGMTARRSYLYWYLLCFFVVGLLPFLGLGSIAERYLYLPSVALSFLFILILYRLCVFLFKQRGRLIFSLVVSLVVVFNLFQLLADQRDWYQASDIVYNSLSEFRSSCDSFEIGEVVVRRPYPNRIGRAWVYQVGYEQAANLVCPKGIRIVGK